MSSAVTTRKQHRTVGGYVWFAFMVGGWTAFFALLLLSQSTLADTWRDLRGLPLIVEALVWFALFPLLLATAVWESSWETWLRLLLVGGFALFWSVMFIPRGMQSS